MTQTGGMQPAATSGGSGTGGLFDILELILDRGLVIDVFVRVSLVGIEILKIDVRIVIASVDTYLRFAEACNRLDLESGRKAPDKLTDIVGNLVESGARGKTGGAIGGAIDAIGDIFDRDDKDRREEDR
ncbi:gas vesicle protein GvpJ [Streptomyces sp. NPDC006235]|uniref:gas vesicle protein GvpJ n=1 Tax=Streptomyces sp. NPDC006235 TaxID=3156736 RepID=UPI0033ADAA89